MRQRYNPGLLFLTKGMDDIGHSQVTKDKVHGMMLEKEQKGRDTVENHVTLTRERFAT